MRQEKITKPAGSLRHRMLLTVVAARKGRGLYKEVRKGMISPSFLNL